MTELYCKFSIKSYQELREADDQSHISLNLCALLRRMVVFSEKSIF